MHLWDRSPRRLAAFAAVVALCISFPALAAQVTAVRIGAHPTFTRIVFELDGRAGYQVERAGTDAAPELKITIDATSSARELRASGDVRGMKVDAGTKARAHIALSPGLRVHEMMLADPPRIVIDLHKPETAVAATKPAAKPKAVAKETPAPEPAPKAAQPEPAPKVAVKEAKKPAPEAKPVPETKPAPKEAPPPAPTPKVAAKETPKVVAKESAKSAPEPKPVPEAKPTVESKPTAESTPAPKEAPPRISLQSPAEDSAMVPAPRVAPPPTAEAAPPKPADAEQAAAPIAPPAEAPHAPTPESDAKLPPAPSPVPPPTDEPRMVHPKPLTPTPAEPAAPAAPPAPSAGWTDRITSDPIWIGGIAAVVLGVVAAVVLRRRRALPNDLDVTAIADEIDQTSDTAASGRIPSGGFAMGDDSASDSAPQTTLSSLFDRPASPAPVWPAPAPPAEPATVAAADAAEDSLFDDAGDTPGEPDAREGDAPMNQEMDLPVDRPSPHAARMGGSAAPSPDIARMLQDFERRIATLEARLDESNEAREKLERQVAAQSEELRVQRAAIARTQRALRTMTRGDEDKATEPALRDGDTQAKTRVTP